MANERQNVGVEGSVLGRFSELATGEAKDETIHADAAETLIARGVQGCVQARLPVALGDGGPDALQVSRAAP